MGYESNVIPHFADRQELTKVGPHSKDAPTNPRGIPYAPFVDKVEDYVTSRADVEPTMNKFQEMIASVNYVRTR